MWTIACMLCMNCLVANGQLIVIRMIDVINNKEMFRGNDIYEAGFKMLKEDQARLDKIQTLITGCTQLMVERETAKMQDLLNIDAFFSEDYEWQNHFMDRMDTVSFNLDKIKRMINTFPRTSKLVVAYKRLMEDLDDAKLKFDQAVKKDGEQNMMRNDERNHLALLAEEQLEQVARLSRDLYNAIPQTREKVMNEN